MSVPAIRVNVGSAVTRDYANAVGNNGYSNTADAIRLNPGVTGSAHEGALLADFRLDSVTFSTAPVAGSIHLVAVDRDFSGNAGVTPSSTMHPRLCGIFSPQPQASNASTTFDMALNAIALSPDADYYLFNNGTSVSLSDCIITAQCWSPGTA